MTDNIEYSIENEVIPEEATDLEEQVEESDITEDFQTSTGTSSQPFESSEPSEPSQHIHKLQIDSDSEEDVTEESCSVQVLTQDFNNLNSMFSSSQAEESDMVHEESVHPNYIGESDLAEPNIPVFCPSTSTNTTGSSNVSLNNTRGRSVSNLNPYTTSSWLLPRSQRVWEMDRQAPECRRCHRRFNFLVRRHHCRRCGQIVCDKCSSNRLKLPVEEIVEDPIISESQYPVIALQSQRVCDNCYREPIRRSSDSQQRRVRSIQYDSMRRSDSSQSLMIDCPVCGHSFLGMQKVEQEDHLHRCLNVGSPPIHAPRYIVYEISEDSTQIGDECPICFDEFVKGDKISRMICLCSYHRHCLASWLERGKGCPVHYDSLQE